MNAKAIPSVESASARGFKGLVLGVVLAVAGTVATTAWAQPAPGGFGPVGFGGPGLFAGGPMHGKALERMLDGVNATDAQRTQIKQIAQAAAADLKTQREAGRSLHEQGIQLFSAPVVDARAVEALRVQAEAQHDQASKRISQAMLDIAAVLTPEQRVKIAEHLKQGAERMRARPQRGGDHDIL